MIQLETHKRYCYRKEKKKPRPKSRPKHPLKVHVWAGISKKGPTIFEGIMNAPVYIEILKIPPVPFIRQKFPAPNSHRFMQDNDPKRTSRAAQIFYQSNGINWWHTPPIENMWHELKEYIRREIKPKTKDELLNGILQFWDTVTVFKCERYIDHLQKVQPVVIENGGKAT